MERGRFDEAQQVYETALAASRKAHPEPHVDVGYVVANLGRLALERQQYAEAERRYREAVGIYEKTLPPGHGYMAAALTMLGRAQLELGRPQEAEATLTARAGGVVDGLRRQERVLRADASRSRPDLGRATAVCRSGAGSARDLSGAGASASRRSADGDRAPLDRRAVPGHGAARSRRKPTSSRCRQRIAPRAHHSPIVRLACASRNRAKSAASHADLPTRAEVQGELPCEF